MFSSHGGHLTNAMYHHGNLCKMAILKKTKKLVFKNNYMHRLMQVKSIAEPAILSTLIKLLFVIKIFVLSIFERLFYCSSKTNRSKKKKESSEIPFLILSSILYPLPVIKTYKVIRKQSKIMKRKNTTYV